MNQPTPTSRGVPHGKTPPASALPAPALPRPPALASLLAQGAVALFLDFDGTLVDIAPTPDGIQVPGDLATRIAALDARLGGRVALVSGRGIADLERYLGPLSVAAAGSHGADIRDAGGAALGEGALGLPPGVLAEIEDHADNAGLRYEAKPHGAALHSRGNPQAEASAADFMQVLADRHGLAVKHGKAVAELVHPGADKGAAVRVLLDNAPFAGAIPVFVGDDITDEDGFAAVQDAGGIAIAVGERESQHANFALADVAAVHHWLWA